MHELLEKRTEELRKEVDRLGTQRLGRRYPEALRRDIVKHAEECFAAGIPWAQVAKGVGITGCTLLQWRKDALPPQQATFLPVAVIEPPRHSQGQLVVHGPAGLRIEGLDLDGVAELIRRLA
jgi:hypothetical protein